jgi:hypothetical protein
MIDAATDAAFVQPGTWLSADEALVRARDQIVPRPFLPSKAALSPGEFWARELRPISTLSPPEADVPLAEGVIAEGYALKGPLGLALESVALLASCIAAASMLGSTRGFVRLWGVSVITQPLLFERGVFGIVGGFSEALQVSLIAYLLLVVARTLRREGASWRRNLASGELARTA